MTEKILFVDDEVHILDSMRRQLRKRFDIATAESGKEALEKFKTDGPFAVVVSDMRMPVMDGIKLLTYIKDLYPDTVRMMLTGNADQETAIEAVNKGQIFRFLNKPCPISVLVTSLALAQRQYRLLTAEKELLDKTLKGSINVLSELLSIANPTAFSSGVRIRSLALKVAQELSVTNLWQLEIAALMSQIGCVTLPGEILNKRYANVELSPEESEMLDKHPQVGASLLENIPRLEGVVSIIRKQLQAFSAYDPGDLDPEEINIGAQILRTVLDYDLLLFQGLNQREAIKHLGQQMDVYNPEIVLKLSNIKMSEELTRIVSLRVKELAVGMYVEENIMARNGTLLTPKGQEITWPVLQGLLNFSKQLGVVEPVRVRIIQK